MRRVVISDYGRLSTLGPLAPKPGWVLDTGNTEDIKDALVAGANAWFSEQLFPIAWKAFTLEPSSGNPNPTTSKCTAIARGPNQYPAFNFFNEPASGQVCLAPRLVALGRGDPDRQPTLWSSFSTPPAKLTDPLFAPPNQGGLGLYKPWFFLRNFTPFGKATCVYPGP